ncbi:LmrCD-specific DARPin [Trypanosoma conorhini]|uniref:LmrCD-specific DARPin n=1 Tax=Trypanosoma conorhini TaxID=83891 RepID=A0A3R7M0M5_9TRYP|nr:LmrCD-specific DARPin [Trypanosoma conorhini]RNF24311.1 LmrCD-specific DARPin [Trypanosoma conorhini]
MSSDDPARPKTIVWKRGTAEDKFYADEQMRHVVNAIKNGDEAPLLRWMDLCEDIDVRDSCGNTALHWAASLGSMPAVTQLLLAGAEVDAVNHNGAVPLHCAAICGHADVIEQLLRNGADATAVNYEGQTMFDLLRLMGWEGASLMLERLENALLLGPGSGENIIIDVSFSDAPLLGSLAAPLLMDAGYSEENVTDVESPLRIQGRRHHYATVGATNISDEDLVYMQRSAEIELLFSRETAERNELIGEYARWMLRVKSMMLPENVASVVRGPREVEVVFGEKYSPHGPRQLLVRMVGDAEGDELWVNAEDVADSPAVREYVDRFNRTVNTLNNSLDLIGLGVLHGGDPSGNAERQDLSSGLNKLSQGNAHVLPRLPVSGTSTASTKLIPPLWAPTSAKILSQQPVNEQKLTRSLNTPLSKMTVSRSSQDSSHGGPPRGSMLSTLTYQNSSTTTGTTRDSKDDNNQHADRVLPPIISNKLECAVAVSLGAEPTVVQCAVPTESKLPPIRQYLSGEEKRAYEAFLRMSALRYLERRRGRRSHRVDIE